MRAAVLAALLLAGPAGAGCFTADELPARAIYGRGSALEYLGRDGDVLTYRSGQMTSRMKDGIWPLDNRGDGYSAEYIWDTPPPSLAEIAASGGKARVEGSKTETGKSARKVAIEIEILGNSTLDWEDCRYEVTELRKTIWQGETKFLEGVLLYAPGAMILFRSNSVDPATDRKISFALERLE